MSGEGRGRGFFMRQLESGYSTDPKTEDDRSKASPGQPPVGGRGKFMQILQVRNILLDYSRMLVVSLLHRTAFHPYICCCCISSTIVLPVSNQFFCIYVLGAIV